MNENLRQKLKSFITKKNLIILLAILVVISLVYTSKTQNKVVEGCEDSATYNRITGEPCLGAILPESKPEDNPGYQNALIEYQGRSISFDQECIATPSNLEVIRMAKVMLANNSQKVQEFSAGEKTSTLPPYRYTTVSFEQIGVIDVYCNGEKSATINVK